MKRTKTRNLKINAIEPFEHLEDVLYTMPFQRYQWLKQAWNFWREIRKFLPKRIINLQDKFREGKI